MKRLMTSVIQGLKGQSSGESDPSSTHPAYSRAVRSGFADLTAYQGLLLLSAARRPVRSTQAIRPADDLVFGCPPLTLLDHYGTPDANVLGINPLAIQFVVYRHLFGNFKIKSEYHFSKDGLFYLNRSYSSRSAGTLSRKDLDELLRLLVEKYLAGADFNSEQDKIVDEEGVEILFSLRPEVTVDYLWSMSPALAELKAELNADLNVPT